MYLFLMERMMQMMESGLTEYWRKKLWPKFPTNVECQAQSADGTNSGEWTTFVLFETSTKK